MSKASDWSWPVEPPHATRRKIITAKRAAFLMGCQRMRVCRQRDRHLHRHPVRKRGNPYLGYLPAIGVKTKRPNDERILAPA